WTRRHSHRAPAVCPCGQGRADTSRDFSPAGSVCHRPPRSCRAETVHCRSCDQPPRWPARRPRAPSTAPAHAVARLPAAQLSACWQYAGGRADSPNCWAPAAGPPAPKTASRGSTFVLSLGRLGTYTGVRSAAVGERGRAMLLLSNPNSSASLQTLVEPVTKGLQCVKVHRDNAPGGNVPEHYLIGSSSARAMAL